jgi:excinuclease ABC subunit C
VPDSPGVYRFRDEHGRVIYVGKAKSLRSRLGSYFQDIAALHPRTQTMVRTAAAVDWTIVGTEVEALQLEYSWIKEFDPRFNVRYRDDKSYPWLAVTLDEEFPRAQVMRGAKRRGVKYFGPYAHAWAIRETLDTLLRVFPMRTCSAGVFKRAGQVGRPCLLGYIGKCAAPCVGRVSQAEHREIAEDLVDFLSGQTQKFMRRLEREMRAASEAQEYERAARLRDDLGALARAMEKQAVVLGDGTDADVVAFAQDELEAAVQVFYVRGGRVRGQRGWVVDKVEEIGTPGLVEQFLTQAYLDAEAADSEVPREVLVPELPEDVDVVTELLELVRGGKVSLRVPQRGDKRALLETVERNAKEAFTRHKLKRSSDLTSRSRALQELQDALGLPQAPLRIECYDVSNLQGSDIVASMVVFEDGLPRKSEYRRFAIKGIARPDRDPVQIDVAVPAHNDVAVPAHSDVAVPAHSDVAVPAHSDVAVPAHSDVAVPAQNDTAAIHEVISRRFRRYLEERIDLAEIELDDSDEDREAGHSVGTPIDPDTGKPRKFAYPPQLVVVDGGAPQVAAAAAAMAALGIEDVSLCGLAKRLEEVWLPGSPDPVILPRTSEALYLLQRVRDEAHRFAITYHRQRRSAGMTASALDGVPGLGETRRKALLRRFGSVKRLRAASVEEIAAVPGLGRRTAEAVHAALAASGPGQPAVDPTTGEVLESGDTSGVSVAGSGAPS